ncbi:hypothetical protein SNE40_001916 [Patella caerulea]|uniref:RNase H type-1 domain-containing protein n=1 Tax=Patella caerulea TaxID=87958 RepID=A0AAN8K658_PATCE
MQIVLGNIVRFNTRFLYDCVLGRASWNSSVKITPEAFGELRFWNNSLRHLNSSGVEICNLDAENTFDFEVFCDASDVGFGGYFSACLDARFESGEVFGNWHNHERVQSSTWRELAGVQRTVRSFAKTFENKRLIVSLDNKNVEHILKVGSSKMNLHGMASDIRYNCKENNINLHAVWVPGEQNKKADGSIMMTGV